MARKKKKGCGEKGRKTSTSIMHLAQSDIPWVGIQKCRGIIVSQNPGAGNVKHRLCLQINRDAGNTKQ